jgi:hypothetical protein
VRTVENGRYKALLSEEDSPRECTAIVSQRDAKGIVR